MPDSSSRHRSRGARIAYLASLCVAVLVSAVPAAAAALGPEQIALVVNAKVPAGVKLAEYYAAQRNIPAGRVIALDLPEGDDIAFEQYNQQVVPAVRKYLKDKNLEEKVTCLVTFYGVPLRIARRVATPMENEESTAIDKESAGSLERARVNVATVEALAKELDPAFKPGTNNELPALPGRADAAIQATLKALARDADAAHRAARFTRLLAPIEGLYGSLETVERLSRPPYSQLADKPLTAQQVEDHQANAKKLAAELNGLLPRAHEAEARARTREVVKQNFGAFGHLKVLSDQKARLRPDETESAFDSDLALLWWPDDYTRYRWQTNPLNYRLRDANAAAAAATVGRPPGKLPKTLMVMRLDGPTEQQVRDLITTSIRVEKEGLQGVVAVDARGKPPTDAYGQYDQTIRNLASLVKLKTRLEVVLDDKEAVFPKGSVKNVALYCGWYSLRRYVPGMSFSPGAVGYHIASLELLSLHTASETGWVRGLLTDGVAASLGAVAEPYLHSFPAADEFFPLLLTGRLTLAEVYWYSNPLTSWMNTCIGDPLYTPYKANPALKVEDVPLKLHVLFE